MGDHAQSFNIGKYLDAVQQRVGEWQEQNLVHRLWHKDGTVWVPDPDEAARTPELTNRMDWLNLPATMPAQVGALRDFAREIRAAGFTHLVLLGMGGSSLAPEVFMTLFGHAAGQPPLTVLDSTDPEAVAAVEKAIDLAHTLFIVSSKSGGTLETLSGYRYFFDRVRQQAGDGAGRQFIAITDPGSTLETLAREQGFRRIFSGEPGVGGRFSALTAFGLVPAALIGVDVAHLLEQAGAMAEACGPDVPAGENPGIFLGAALGELARAGRDKLTFLSSPMIAHITVWIEQLIAESTGKHGVGILPVPDEPVGDPREYGKDRAFVYLRLAGDDNTRLDDTVQALEAAGQPVVLIELDDLYDVGAEFFRWEIATAAAGAVLGINPFDQPNVESAKSKAKQLMQEVQAKGQLPEAAPAWEDDGLAVFGGPLPHPESPEAAVRAFFEKTHAGQYLALMAYIPAGTEPERILNQARTGVRRRWQVATTLGYGPRFLHSTGQLHKGGPNHGLFVQITHEPTLDVPVPGEPYSFKVILAAQAQGDMQALLAEKRHALRLHIRGDLLTGLCRISGLLTGA